MQAKIHVQGLRLTEELSEFIDRRLLFALSRFSPRVKDVSVRLTDENAERGGVDTRCRIVVQLTTGHFAVSEQNDATPFGAAASACEGVRRAVSRIVKRSFPSKPDRHHRTSAANER